MSDSRLHKGQRAGAQRSLPKADSNGLANKTVDAHESLLRADINGLANETVEARGGLCRVDNNGLANETVRVGFSSPALEACSHHGHTNPFRQA